MRPKRTANILVIEKHLLLRLFLTILVTESEPDSTARQQRWKRSWITSTNRGANYTRDRSKAPAPAPGDHVLVLREVNDGGCASIN